MFWTKLKRKVRTIVRGRKLGFFNTQQKGQKGALMGDSWGSAVPMADVHSGALDQVAALEAKLAASDLRLAASDASLAHVIARLSVLERASLGENAEDITSEIYKDATLQAKANEYTWVLLTATIVFLMQYGFALLENGMCRKNNTTATYTKNMLDAALGTLVAIGFGYQIAYRESPIVPVVGTDEVLMESSRVSAAFFHHLVFQATAATIVSGAMAERTTISAYCILSSFISGIPFSLAVRWTWGGGWLNDLGFIDFAGGTVVHVVGGAAAVAGVYVVGERE